MRLDGRVNGAGDPGGARYDGRRGGCSIKEVRSALRGEDEATRETERTITSIRAILER